MSSFIVFKRSTFDVAYTLLAIISLLPKPHIQCYLETEYAFGFANLQVKNLC